MLVKYKFISKRDSKSLLQKIDAFLEMCFTTPTTSFA